MEWVDFIGMVVCFGFCMLVGMLVFFVLCVVMCDVLCCGDCLNKKSVCWGMEYKKCFVL